MSAAKLPNRLFDLVYYQNENFPQKDTLSYKVDGVWKNWSTQDFIDSINQCSLALMSLGLKKGDMVALISTNRPEWNIIDHALLQLGIVNVPIYPTISEKDYEFIFNHAEIKAVFLEDKGLLKKIKAIETNVSTLKNIFSINPIDGCDSYEDFMKTGKEEDNTTLEEIKQGIDPESLATIIYTSGTTGTPKGVMLSHRNIISNIKSVYDLLPLNKDHKTLSFLPLCHIFERMVTYIYISKGCSVHYCSVDDLAENLQDVKPDYFTTVPRLLEKVYEKIMAKAAELTGFKKKLFGWAMEKGLNYDPKKRQGLSFIVADKLVFSKWREALGGNVKGIITGAAACQERLARVFSAAGVAIREGYGQSETSPVITLNQLEGDGFMFGTVGPPVPGVEVKIDPNTNEVLAKGENVMMGYYKRPDITAETVDEDGWIHTGDTGTFIEGRFLKITGRIKELFKTSGGKYVAPAVIEEKMKESQFIEQIMVIGENEKFVSALVVPSFEFIREWGKQKGLTLNTNKDIAESKEVRDVIFKDVNRLNVNFSKVEQIKKIKILSEEWTVESGALTPTMKVKRRVVLKDLANIIEEIYRA